MNLLTKPIEIIKQDKHFISKAGILFGINFIITLLGTGLQATTYLINPDSGSGGVSDTSILLYMGIFCSFLFVLMIVYFLWALYSLGYMTEFADRIRRGTVSDVLPEHDRVFKKIKLGGFVSVIEFIAFLIPTLVSAIPMILLGILMFSTSEEPPVFLLFIVLAAFFLGGLVSFLLYIFFSMICVPAAMYQYLATGHISSVFSMSRISTIIRLTWKPLLIITLLSFVISMIQVFVSYVCCCINFILGPLMQTLVLLWLGAALGCVFREVELALKDNARNKQ